MVAADRFAASLRGSAALAMLRERGPWLVAGIAALLIGIQLASIATEWAGGADRPQPSAREAGYIAPAQAGASANRVDLGALVTAHLFGEARANAAASGADAPQTSMPLVLAGVLAADDPGGGFAIVGESAAAAKFYPVGASLPGGARLQGVYPDRIVIDRAGVLESLSLPKRPLAGAVSGPPAGSLPMTGAEGGGVDAARAERLAQRMRQAVEQNPGVLANVLRAQQVMAGGRQRGFRVYPGANPAAFSRLGLRPGDLITAVNGTPLDDPSKGDEVIRTLGAAPEVRVTITRNGRQSDLVLDMTRVTAEADQLFGPDGAPVPASDP